MLTIELTNPSGETPIVFDILPSAGLPDAVVQAQFELARQLSSALGSMYYFLVTTDWVRGWRLSDGALVFRAPTDALLAPYAAGDAARVRNAGEHYLAELTQAWIADLTSHWRSGGAHAPGEAAMNASVLGLIRSAASATTGSV